MIALSEIKLYQILCKRESNNAKKYGGLLIPIASHSNQLLTYIKRIFPYFPDHGIQHSFRILQYVSSILTDREINLLTDTEIFCLIVSALFHDAGMALINEKDKNQLRENHHYKSEVIINKYFDEKLGLLDNADRIKKVVLFACKGHGRSINDLYKDTDFERIDNINFDKVRYSILAVLIRIGDLMDIEGMRSNSFAIELFKGMFSEESLNHNIRHQNIQYYNYSPEKIDIEVIATNVEQYKIWSSWFTYLHDDILRANTYLKDFRFPVLNYKINKENGAKYDVQELRFEIDDRGGIWNIISQSIYTNKLDFLRELIQNSIDASLMKIYINKDIVLSYKSPRSWNAHKYCNNITVAFSEKENKMYVVDQGTGMSEYDLNRFLFKISSSGNANSFNRDFEFAGIAKYGIGFISCLINAKSIKIYTKKDNEEDIHYVSLESNSNLAFMENVQSNNFTGTTIVLDLKNKYSFIEITNYIVNTFKYASVGINLINIDDMLLTSQNLGFSHVNEELKIKPYILTELYNTISKKQSAVVDPIMKKCEGLFKLSIYLDDLINWMRDNEECEANYTDRQKFKDFKKKVSQISQTVELEHMKDDFPLSVDSISEKSLLTTREYTESIEEYHQKVTKKYNEAKCELSKYPKFQKTIFNPDIFEYSSKKYIIALLDENLEISRIISTDEAIDLSKETGILILNHKAVDSKNGHEYACVNGLLFSKGEVCNSIARFSGSKLIYSRRSTAKNRIVGSYYDYDEAQYALEEAIADNYYESDDLEELNDIYEPTYDVLCIQDNKILFIKEIAGVDYDLRYSNNLDKYNLNPIIETYRRKVTSLEELDDFEKMMCHLKSEYYQDGILIPFDIENIIPFGYFKIICNTTADSRMTLNVTRHNTSRIHADIEKWMYFAGDNIQKSIINNMMKMIEELKLIADYKRIKFRNKDDYLNHLCKENIFKFMH